MVSVSSLDTSFIQGGLTELPNTLIDSEALVANSCVARSQQPSGTFVITGNNTPAESSADVSGTVYATGSIQTIVDNPTSSGNLPHPILEPEAIYQLSDGRLIMSRKCE